MRSSVIIILNNIVRACESLVPQLCPTLSDPMDSSPPNSSVYGILQASCHFLLHGNFLTQGLNLCLLHCKLILYQLSHQRSLVNVFDIQIHLLNINFYFNNFISKAFISYLLSTRKYAELIVGYLGLIPGPGRFPEWKGYQLQYSCLENSMDSWTWQATFHGPTKSQAWLSTEQHHYPHFTEEEMDMTFYNWLDSGHIFNGQWISFLPAFYIF